MEILLAMIFGLGLRFVLFAAQGRAYPIIVGVWEGACLRYCYLSNQAHSPSGTVDPLLSYAVRLCIDFFITSSFVQVIFIALWSFLAALALEAIESGNSVDSGKAPRSPSKKSGTSFTKVQTLAVSPPSTTASLTIESDSTISPLGSAVDLRGTPTVLSPILERHASPIPPPPPPVPNLPSEFSDTHSSVVHGSYTLPPPVLIEQQTQSPQHGLEAPLLYSMSTLNPDPVSPLTPAIVMDREAYEDELQTPMQEGDAPIADEDDRDELQTPIALPIANIGFGELVEPPELNLGPSMLLTPSDDVPPRSMSVSPVPVPIPIRSPSNMSQMSQLSSPHAMSALSSSPSPPASILSASSPTRMYARAEELRKQAWKENRVKSQLEKDLREARTEGRNKDVFMLLGEIKAAQTRIDRLHMRAKRRYYHARNKPDSNTLQIDVHGLLVHEAVEETEEAFRDVLRNGNRFLRIIVGRGNHSRDGVPKLRPAIIQAMQQHGFKCTVVTDNPGVVILEAPS